MLLPNCGKQDRVTVTSQPAELCSFTSSWLKPSSKRAFCKAPKPPRCITAL
jgi:hypothetical protein